MVTKIFDINPYAMATSAANLMSNCQHDRECDLMRSGLIAVLGNSDPGSAPESVFSDEGQTDFTYLDYTYLIMVICLMYRVKGYFFAYAVTALLMKLAASSRVVAWSPWTYVIASLVGPIGTLIITRVVLVILSPILDPICNLVKILWELGYQAYIKWMYPGYFEDLRDLQNYAIPITPSDMFEGSKQITLDGMWSKRGFIPAPILDQRDADLDRIIKRYGISQNEAQQLKGLHFLQVGAPKPDADMAELESFIADIKPSVTSIKNAQLSAATFNPRPSNLIDIVKVDGMSTENKSRKITVYSQPDRVNQVISSMIYKGYEVNSALVKVDEQLISYLCSAVKCDDPTIFNGSTRYDVLCQMLARKSTDIMSKNNISCPQQNSHYILSDLMGKVIAAREGSSELVPY